MKVYFQDLSNIYNIYIRQVLAIYFQVFFLALQCSDKPESSYQASYEGGLRPHNHLIFIVTIITNFRTIIRIQIPVVHVNSVGWSLYLAIDGGTSLLKQFGSGIRVTHEEGCADLCKAGA